MLTQEKCNYVQYLICLSLVVSLLSTLYTCAPLSVKSSVILQHNTKCQLKRMADVSPTPNEVAWGGCGAEFLGKSITEPG